jgi:PAS domain S-box-containing protein
VLAAVGRLRLADWGISATFPASLVERQVRGSLWLWGTTIVVVGALVVALALLFGRELTQPLAAATAAAGALGRGERFVIHDSRLSEANAVNAAPEEPAATSPRAPRRSGKARNSYGRRRKPAQFGAHQYDVANDRAQRSPQIRQILGADDSDEVATFESGLAFVHPDDRDRTRLRKQQIIAGAQKRYELEYRIRRPDGQVRRVMDRGQVVREPQHKQATRIVGVLLDITELKAAEQRQRLLFDELNHRVKNTLSIVQSLAQQTLRTRPDPQDFARAFEDRLQSLARAHDLLTRDSWRGAPLDEIVAGALAPFLDESRPIRIAGGPVMIAASTTITLSLMLHELATNAAKYGACPVSDGKCPSAGRSRKPAHRSPSTSSGWKTTARRCRCPSARASARACWRRARCNSAPSSISITRQAACAAAFASPCRASVVFPSAGGAPLQRRVFSCSFGPRASRSLMSEPEARGPEDYERATGVARA